MADLGDYLRAGGGKAREAGVHDCAALPAGWAVLCGWPDPMASWRGAYADEAGAEALIFDAGSLVALFSAAAEAAGIPEADEPTAGDIGVIRVGDDEAGAIFTGKRWAFAADRGIACSSVDAEHVVKVWRCG